MNSWYSLKSLAILLAIFVVITFICYQAAMLLISRSLIKILIGIIILMCVNSLCLCKIMKSWHPLKSLAISLAIFVAITFICYLVAMVLISNSIDSHWGWLGAILLMSHITLNLLIVIPPSILITHAIVTNDASSKIEEYTYIKTIFLFVVISIIVFVVAFIGFKLTGR
ncbi:MAG: hypothetical protein LBP33_10300 [Candidatus Adiutrix sp.]|jgi:hypothetical protein|nr:hypothetical protein [Candidatus Adiutrix sp.]